jgi:hypothetical protein
LQASTGLARSTAAISAVTGAATSWAPVTVFEVDSIAAGGNSVFLAGGSGTLAGTPTNGAAAVDSTTGAPLTFPDVGNLVSVLTVATTADGSWAGFGLAGSQGFVLPTGVDHSGLVTFDIQETLTAGSGGGGGGGGSSSFTLTVSPPSQTIVGGSSASWTVSITNTGGAYLYAVIVTDPAAPGCNPPSPDSDALYFMPPGLTVTYSCSRANVTASFTNTVLASAVTATGDTLTSSADASVAVQAATPTPPASPPVSTPTAKPTSSRSTGFAELVVTRLETIALRKGKPKLAFTATVTRATLLELTLLDPNGKKLAGWRKHAKSGKNAYSLLLPAKARHKGREELRITAAGNPTPRIFTVMLVN